MQNNAEIRPRAAIPDWSQKIALHEVYVTMIPPIHGPEVLVKRLNKLEGGGRDKPKAGPVTVPPRKKPIAVPLCA